eukprot:gene13469-biopygen12557
MPAPRPRQCAVTPGDPAAAARPQSSWRAADGPVGALGQRPDECGNERTDKPTKSKGNDIARVPVRVCVFCKTSCGPCPLRIQSAHSSVSPHCTAVSG